MIIKFVLVCALVVAPALGSAIKGHPAREEATKSGRQLLSPIAQQKLVEQTKSTVQKLEHVAVEQRKEEPIQQQQPQAPIAEQKLEELPSKIRYEQKQEELSSVQQKEELPAREETKGGQQKYEAKTQQVSREELAKGQQRYEQRQETVVAVEQKQQEQASKTSIKYEQKREELPSKTRYEQKQEEAPAKGTKYEQKPEESKLEFVAVEQQRAELSKTSYEQKQEERYEQQQREYDQQIELKEEQRHYEEQPAIVQQQQQQEEIQQQRETYQEATKGGQAPLAEAEPYAFSYQVEGSSRTESGDTKGTVRGQYTIQGADGSSRVVDYIADHNGFRASVNTNEFGTEAKSPANIALRTSQPLAEEITLRLEGKTKEDLAAPAAAVKGAASAPAKPENWQVKGAQLPLAQYEELPKGAPAATKKTAVVQEEILRTQPVVAVAAAAAPAKGQRLVQVEEVSQSQQELVQQAPQQPEPVKSAELRAPKAISGDLKLGQARAGFESATAHRVYRAQPAVVVAPARPIRPVAPAVVVRAQAPPLPARLPVPAVSRSYLQRERYPPSPVQQVGYRRELPVQTNPRVSFYAPASAQSVSSSAGFDDDQPSSFEQPDS